MIKRFINYVTLIFKVICLVYFPKIYISYV